MPKKKSPDTGSLAEILESWLAAWKPQTHNFQVAREIRQHFGHLKPKQLTAFSLDALVRTWRSKYARATTHGRVLALRRFLRLLDASAGTDLRQTVRPEKNPGPRKVIAKEDEQRRLFHHAEPWQRLWLLLCSELAMRNAEARSIGPDNYNREHQTVSFCKKGGDTHVLPVTPNIAALFDAAPFGEPDMTYIERWRGKKMTKAAVEHQWRKLKKLAQVRYDLRCHDLRRTTAVSLYNLSRDLRAVSHLLGHQSMAATCGYLAPHDPQDLRPLLAQLKPITEVKQ